MYLHMNYCGSCSLQVQHSCQGPTMPLLLMDSSESCDCKPLRFAAKVEVQRLEGVLPRKLTTLQCLALWHDVLCQEAFSHPVSSETFKASNRRHHTTCHSASSKNQCTQLQLHSQLKCLWPFCIEELGSAEEFLLLGVGASA